MKKLFTAFVLAIIALVGIFFWRDGVDGVADGKFAFSDTDASKSETLIKGIFRAAQAGDQPATAPQVDESALRYFASQGDTARFQAEIKRLKTLYPNWTPPDDPLAPADNRDEKLDELWALYGEGRYAELRRLIASRKVEDAAWEAPAELLQKLEHAEKRQRLVNASDNKQYDMVVSLAAEAPELLVCGEVDVLWRLSEAFAKLGKTDRARDGYIYILDNCTVQEERLATIQKALANLPYNEAQEVLAHQKNGTDGKEEFAPQAADIARHFLALAAGDPEIKLDPHYLSTVEALAEQQKLASDAEMLGWYYLRRNDMKPAENWLLRAQEKDDSPTIAQGLALVFSSQAQYEQAENVMYPWREQSPEAASLYFSAATNLLASDPPIKMPANIPQNVMTRIAAATIAAKNADTAQQLGWYARSVGQHASAMQWFQTALAWEKSNEPAAYGLALSLHLAEDQAALASLKNTWSGHSQRIADVGTERARHSNPAIASAVPEKAAARPAQSASATKHTVAEAARRRATPASARKTSTANIRDCQQPLAGPLPTGGSAVALGWCQMDRNRPVEAVKSFESALASGTSAERSDAAYGQALAYLRLGLLDQAAAASIKAPLSKQRQKELRVAILSDRALAAYEGGNFRETLLLLEQRSQLAAPRKDLMGLQAAAYLRLNRLNDSRIVYEALAASGDREGIRGLAVVRELMGEN
ncbi:cellulose synthase [Falsochrobactrum shanghaiense]|uniref:Cellulose synthase n=1 Tax=Falsochrobactrum shanghaiense TaxID=2201899 RepID=A0A316J8Q5_9HYPH|nr:cellulose synthase [Falsochrobactrum shanghaiense]PWL17548.1 cellulose synthase [Falsochrobactrum shanghaiense]